MVADVAATRGLHFDAVRALAAPWAARLGPHAPRSCPAHDMLMTCSCDAHDMRMPRTCPTRAAHPPRTCFAHATHAPRTTHHAPRTTHHAPRTTHRAPCTTHTPRTPQVSRVYVLGLPANADTYLHLAGRTGRWPRPEREEGEATVVTIATEAELRTLRGWSNMLGGVNFTPIE